MKGTVFSHVMLQMLRMCHGIGTTVMNSLLAQDLCVATRGVFMREGCGHLC